MAIKNVDVHEEKQHRGYRCYDGQLLLPFDFDEPFYVRDTSSMTEQAYLDKEKQIASFIRSGEQLQNFRRGDFDYPDCDVPEDAVPDPTQSLGFDFADYSALLARLRHDLAASSNKAEEEAAPAEGVAGGTAEKSSPPTAE